MNYKKLMTDNGIHLPDYHKTAPIMQAFEVVRKAAFNNGKHYGDAKGIVAEKELEDCHSTLKSTKSAYNLLQAKCSSLEKQLATTKEELSVCKNQLNLQKNQVRWCDTRLKSVSQELMVCQSTATNELIVKLHGVNFNVEFTFESLGNDEYDIELLSVTTDSDVRNLTWTGEEEQDIIVAIILEHNKGMEP